ncbi:MAG: serine hydrolase [Chloroflexota bacterium]|nr:MAG: serine hydrolase [Chloroflexota bacterium]
MAKIFRLIAWFIGITLGLLALFILISLLVYPSEYVYRALAWRETDYTDFMEHFPMRKLFAASEKFYFRESLEEDRVSGIFEQLSGTTDFESLLEAENTQAFIVIQDDKILYEKYLNGTQRDTLLTSFSVAKSYDSALIGSAIADGYLKSIDDPITDYLPEMLERDPRFQNVTIRHLLLMASGFEYKEMRWGLLNGDDPLTSYYPDQRQAALEFTKILDSPGEYFLYNKYHPQLLGLILERSTGKTVTEYMQEKIWSPLGTEFDGSMSLDSESSSFEKMETGVNARAIDYAKLGRLYLKNGEWEGEQLLPKSWIQESITIDRENHNAEYYPDEFGQIIYDFLGGYYKYMWYGYTREGEDPDFAAEGDQGQFIYVSPHKNLILVRNATAYGHLLGEDWIKLFYQFATEF